VNTPVRTMAAAFSPVRRSEALVDSAHCNGRSPCAAALAFRA
jgi:hypothetical protein